MTLKLLLRSKTPESRRQRLLSTEIPKSPTTVPEDKKRGFAEVAGSSAAGCTAICCCCPFSVMHLLILAVYKVPAGICKKAWNSQRRSRQRSVQRKGQLLGPTDAVVMGPTGEELLSVADVYNAKDGDGEMPSSSEAVDLENEMWGRFNGTGFWRSLSQKET